jgi:hypothetical protein
MEAYKKLLLTWYVVWTGPDASGQLTKTLEPEDCRPTIHQFRYWLQKTQSLSRPRIAKLHVKATRRR